MGRTGSHLHGFASGETPPPISSPSTTWQRSPSTTPGRNRETEVRLDEVLVEPGDELHAYDFGDNWAHTLTLETVSERDLEAPSAICRAGACPPRIAAESGVTTRGAEVAASKDAGRLRLVGVASG